MADADRRALIAEVDRLRAEREELAARLTPEFIGDVLRQHQLTTGMAVASGHTCQCNYWTGRERPGRTRPVGYQGLQWHQSQAIAAALTHSGAEESS